MDVPKRNNIITSIKIAALVIVLSLISTIVSVFSISRSTKFHPPCPECKVLPVLPKCTIISKNAFARPEHLEHGMGIAQLGEFKELTEAEKNATDLKEYITECSKFKDTWFCHPDLLNQISIKKGYYSYFLVIDGLTTPTFMHLCAFMWANTEYKSWARERNHNCMEFRLENTEY